MRIDEEGGGSGRRGPGMDGSIGAGGRPQHQQQQPSPAQQPPAARSIWQQVYY